MSALSFESSIPYPKNYGKNRILNRGCLAKQNATSALWVESIIIPNVNDSENRISNREGLAKHYPRIPLSVANRRVDGQKYMFKVDMEH